MIEIHISYFYRSIVTLGSIAVALVEIGVRFPINFIDFYLLMFGEKSYL